MAGVDTVRGLGDAAALAEVGDWSAAQEAYAAVLALGESADARWGLARAGWWLGAARSAVEDAERAFAAYDAEARHADAAMVGLHISIWYLTNFDNPSAAAGWLARARRSAETSGDEGAVAWSTLVSAYVADEPDEGLRLIEAAAAKAASLPDRDLSTMALADLGLWHVGAGDVDLGMSMLDEALAAAFGQPRPMLEVAVWSGCDMLAACSMVDDLRRATQWCRVADRFTQTYGCPFLQARCRAHYGDVLVATGRWDDAERELGQALAMAGDTGRGPRNEALTALAELRRCQGDPASALVLLDDTDSTMAGTVVRARCHLDLDEPAEARAVLRAELPLHRTDDPAYPALVAALAEAELASGRHGEAEMLLAPDAPVWTVPAFPRAAALLARAAGLVAGARGDLEAARRQLGFALDTFARLELPYDSARTELTLARLLAPHDRDAAVGRARSALGRQDALGARRDAAEAAALLRSLGETPPPGPRRGAVLSARERDVLGLLAHGLSNPQIAERLFLSPRTVGHHVSSILRKLGLRSRAEAAAYAARSLSGAQDA
jgi:ATP/maltotriose-dependent transcriptional regulator MalT